jgi:hypothetical protein
MADPILGRNAVLELLISGSYYPVLCATDCSFTRTPEFISKTTTTSGLFREFTVRREEWAMSVSGLTKIQNDASISFFYLLQNAVRRTELPVRMTFTDDEGTSNMISGTILLGQMSINGPVSGFSEATVELKGTSSFDIGVTVDPPTTECVLYGDYWTFPAGDTYIQGTSVVHGYSLEAVTVISVDREGVAFDLVTGTPSGRQCKHNNTTGIINFDTALPSNGETVWVVFK